MSDSLVKYLDVVKQETLTGPMFPIDRFIVYLSSLLGVIAASLGVYLLVFAKVSCALTVSGSALVDYVTNWCSGTYVRAHILVWAMFLAAFVVSVPPLLYSVCRGSDMLKQMGAMKRLLEKVYEEREKRLQANLKVEDHKAASETNGDADLPAATHRRGEHAKPKVEKRTLAADIHTADVECAEDFDALWNKCVRLLGSGTGETFFAYLSTAGAQAAAAAVMLNYYWNAWAPAQLGFSDTAFDCADVPCVNATPPCAPNPVPCTLQTHPLVYSWVAAVVILVMVLVLNLCKLLDWGSRWYYRKTDKGDFLRKAFEAAYPDLTRPPRNVKVAHPPREADEEAKEAAATLWTAIVTGVDKVHAKHIESLQKQTADHKAGPGGPGSSAPSPFAGPTAPASAGAPHTPAVVHVGARSAPFQAFETATNV